MQGSSGLITALTSVGESPIEGYPYHGLKVNSRQGATLEVGILGESAIACAAM